MLNNFGKNKKKIIKKKLDCIKLLINEGKQQEAEGILISNHNVYITTPSKISFFWKNISPTI